MANASMGKTIQDIARGLDCYSYHEPLGVCAGVMPFNFPFMVQLWSLPISITLGNTFIIKPSSRVPTGANIFA